MLARAIARQVQAALADTPITLLAGARQVGKSTLARAVAETPQGDPIRIDALSREPDRYLTLDDATLLAAARSDPEGFLDQHRADRLLVVDEVQRAPDLLIAIKRDVDRDRRPGRYLLTGSANVMSIPHISESLAGRMEILQMWPFAQCEIEGRKPTFLHNLFSDDPIAVEAQALARSSIIERALRGGYPEVLSRKTADRRAAWFGSYIATIVQREIRSIAAIEDEAGIVRILRTLASRSGGPRNVQTLATDTGIPNTTIQRYLALLKATYLVAELPAWFRNLDARAIKSPKMLLADSGLYASLLNLTPSDAQVGLLLESFVGAELLRLISFEPTRRFTLMHFRTQKQNEVDFVVEDSGRRIAGVEVKLSRSISGKDFSGLRSLATFAGEAFHRGVVLYSGSRVQSFGDDLYAVPIEALWSSW